jgi:hypothetical protein
MRARAGSRYLNFLKQAPLLIFRSSGGRHARLRFGRLYVRGDERAGLFGGKTGYGVLRPPMRFCMCARLARS